MHIGIIGYGSIGARQARLLLKYTKRITVLSRRSDIPAPFQTVADWKGFRAAGSFDAIFITNETVKHAATITRALALRPRALFIEKPIAMNARQAAAVATAIKRSKTSAWVGYCLQWLEPIVRAKKVVQSGALGRLSSMRVFVGQDLRTWRTRDYRQTYSSRASQGGGVLRDLIHELNYPAWVLGEPLRPVAAHLSRVGRLTTDTETLAESTHVTRSGIVVHVHQDCVRRPGRRTLEIVGDKGVVWWDSDTGEFVQTSAAGVRRVSIIHRPPDDMYQRQLAAFFRMLRSGKPFSNVAEAVQDLRVVDATRRCAARA